ncbi:sulfatase [Paenibacillus radicis (ex Xue et al. 2023)]|uniref:Sulfatase n=1 Tax=Paenibacillus radicis (ex Xue et al. 2023) TaxID=2972489 RepID=A0ABT1YG31_9BACL|nr:sulfatase [Paenibacillus radicis (ex Xue et al. 2023)]MCR8632155.1 sulfatase [Paenibacillus radicis (ex Xue et al. 2023)]
MRAIMVMFDSLNRHMLPNYGCDWTHAPNFKRLAEKTVTFDNCYVGSMPCMPARRDLQTGRYNFLHRSWGPIEPFDDCMPERLKNNQVYTHLVTDHQHYWEDGGATYHTRYSSVEFVRGQEGDPWKGEVKDPDMAETEIPRLKAPVFQKMARQDTINRKYIEAEENFPQAMTFNLGLEFMEKNKEEDKWFLQIETFDPHEPFFSCQHYKDLYPHPYNGKHFDWPPYYFVQESEDVVQHGKYQYAALLSMCDHYLGRVLDLMDQHDMWKDTMLIVNTDHGYLLGEHGWWSKSVMPLYQEIAYIPFFAWDPRLGIKGERRSALVQNVDVAPTLLEFFGVPLPEGMSGKPLKDTILTDAKIRDAALFGFHGSSVNITDGRYVYMRGPVSPDNGPLFEYTLMPTTMRSFFALQQLQNIELQEPFAFTNGCQTMKIRAGSGRVSPFQYGSKLFDLASDPQQIQEVEDSDTELRLIHRMAELMSENDAPLEQYERLGIPRDGILSVSQLTEQKQEVEQAIEIPVLQERSWTRGAQLQMWTLLNTIPKEMRDQTLESFKQYVTGLALMNIEEEAILGFINVMLPSERREMALYFIRLAGRTS